MRGVVVWLGWWAALAAFWLLLVDTTKLPELVAGAVAAAIGASVAAFINAQHVVELRFRASWLLRVPRALLRLPFDSAIVAGALLRRVRGGRVSGSFRAVRFGPARSGREDAGRRVLAKGLDSLGPNSYVVGIDTDEGLMLVHQLVPPEDPASADPMELR